MGKPTNKKSEAVALQAAPDGTAKLLLINLSTEIIVIHSNLPELEDVVLNVFDSAILNQAWIDNRSVQAMVKDGRAAYQWVDRFYQHAPTPQLADVPVELLPADDYERAFARRIAFGPQSQAMEYIAVTRTTEGTGTMDLRYMKGNFLRVLRTAQWLESRVQNRKPVLNALAERIDLIRSM
ncbi:hypothetical protein ANRL1_03573 [Anaerolineae bacterium]|nr:hypothetical protein ANRL1_03573 [Anaerolineae bacterium]